MDLLDSCSILYINIDSDVISTKVQILVQIYSTEGKVVSIDSVIHGVLSERVYAIYCRSVMF